MLSKVKATDLFCQYYAHWIRVYKDGAVRNVTMKKYLMTQCNAPDSFVYNAI